ncbi:hypothetical protein ACO0QE_002380 [Hanseniaspora vineae]
MSSQIVMRHPTTTKAKAFKGAQAEFVFPNDSSDSSTSSNTEKGNHNGGAVTINKSIHNETESLFSKEDYYLSNHYLINAVGSAKMLSRGSTKRNNFVMKRPSIHPTSSISDKGFNNQVFNQGRKPTSTESIQQCSPKAGSESSMPNSSKTGSSDYYSFANISDNTTSRSSGRRAKTSSESEVNSDLNDEHSYYDYSHHSSSPVRRLSTRRSPVASTRKRNSLKITRKAAASGSRKSLNPRISTLSNSGIRHLTLDPNAAQRYQPEKSGLLTITSGSVYGGSVHAFENPHVSNNAFLINSDDSSENSSIILGSSKMKNANNYKFLKSPSAVSLSSVSTEKNNKLPELKTKLSSTSSLIMTPHALKKMNTLSHKIQPNGSVEDQDEYDDEDETDESPNFSSIQHTNSSFMCSPSSSFSKKNSKLKRSNAVRCKGGLLDFFIRLGKFTKKSFRQWKQAIRKKFNKKNHDGKKLNKKSPTVSSIKKSPSMQFKTTSHLKRNFYTNVNIKRSMSTLQSQTNSLKRKISSNASSPKKSAISTLDTGVVLQHNSSFNNTKRNSLRRSPSSIRRAVSIMNNLDKNTNSATLSPSKASLQLSNYILPRSSSVVINSKPFKLDTCQEEEPLDEPEGKANIGAPKSDNASAEHDDYVISTDKMTTYSSHSSSSSSASGNTVYEDAIDASPKARAKNVETHLSAIQSVDSHYNLESEIENEELDISQVSAHEASSVYSAHHILSEIIEEEDEEEDEEEELEDEECNDFTHLAQSLNVIKEETDAESLKQLSKPQENAFLPLQFEIIDSEDSEDTQADKNWIDLGDEEEEAEEEKEEEEEEDQVLPMLLQHYFTQVLQKRIMMNLEINAMQRTYEFNETAQQLVRQVLSDYDGSTQFESNSDCEYESSNSEHELISKRSTFSSNSFIGSAGIGQSNVRRSLTMPISLR